jgi:DNA-binding transcriptional ArsR family regulator
MHSASNTLLKTLADPTRRAIFERLARDGEQTVRVLTEHSGVSQPAVSKHLGRPQARRPGALPARGTPDPLQMSLYSVFWRGRFDRLETPLNRMDQ